MAYMGNNEQSAKYLASLYSLRATLSAVSVENDKIRELNNKVSELEREVTNAKASQDDEYNRKIITYKGK